MPTCLCVCHEVDMLQGTLWSVYGCAACAGGHVVAETKTTNELVHGTFQLTPVTLGKLDAQIHWITNHLTNSAEYRLRLVVGHVQYGSCLVVDSIMIASITPEMVQDKLCRQMSSYFNKHGWPTAVLALLAQTDHAQDPLVALQQAQAQMPPSDHVDGRRVVRDLNRVIPGLRSRQQCPATEDVFKVDDNGTTTSAGTHRCSRTGVLERLIQHVNDHHRWTRAQIADWLESLDVDLSFPTETPAPLPEARWDQMLFIVATSYVTARDEARRRGRTPSRWQFIEAGGHAQGASTWSRLRGHHGAQFVMVAAGMSDELRCGLEYVQAVEVGEESEPTKGGYGTFSGLFTDTFGGANGTPWPAVGEIDLFEFANHKKLAELPADLIEKYLPKEVTPPKKEKPNPVQLKAKQAKQAEHQQQHLKHDPTKSRRTKKS